MLSQEEINALLQGDEDANEEAEVTNVIEDDEDTDFLNASERDALGEVGNISMGTAATTLFTLLNQRVTITTPKVMEMSLKEIFEDFEDPCVTIKVNYTIGLHGNNLMVLNAKDVKVITDLMLGGDGTNIEGELNEMHLSAISEAMNQMIGSASTSLSEMLGEKVDISPPEAFYEDIDQITEESLGFEVDEKAVTVGFRLTVGDLVDSEIMQMMPVSMAKSLIKAVTPPKETEDEPIVESEPVQPDVAPELAQASSVVETAPQAATQPTAPTVQVTKSAQPINAKPVEFMSFGVPSADGSLNADISLIRNVPLEISVELGRTSRKISDILEFSSGSVVELDKVVGESLDIMANGKPIARGEVVVVDENYGIRITEIVVPENRL